MRAHRQHIVAVCNESVAVHEADVHVDLGDDFFHRHLQFAAVGDHEIAGNSHLIALGDKLRKFAVVMVPQCQRMVRVPHDIVAAHEIDVHRALSGDHRDGDALRLCVYVKDSLRVRKCIACGHLILYFAKAMIAEGRCVHNTFPDRFILFILKRKRYRRGCVCTALSKCAQRQAAYRHKDRDQHSQQAAKAIRFLHTITPFHYLFQACAAVPHVPPVSCLKSCCSRPCAYAARGQRDGNCGSGLLCTSSASVLSPSRKGRAITSIRASSIS